MTPSQWKEEDEDEEQGKRQSTMIIMIPASSFPPSSSSSSFILSSDKTAPPFTSRRRRSCSYRSNKSYQTGSISSSTSWSPWSLPSPSSYYVVYILLIVNCLFARTSALKCYVCSQRENPAFTLDSHSFRIVDELQQDHCRYLDEVQCDRDQDICITIVQYRIDEGKRAPRSYSVAKGCYVSSNLDLNGVLYKRGCHKETSEIKEDISNAQFKSRRINIHQAMKYTCVCNTNKCNSATITSSISSRTLLVAVISWIYFFVRGHF